MGSLIKEPKKGDIKKAIDNIKLKPSLKPFKKKEEFAISLNEIFKSINASIISSSRLVWL